MADEPEIDGDGMMLVHPPTGVDYEAIRTFQTYCHAQSRARGFHDEPDELKDLAGDLRAQGREVLGDYIESMYYGNRLMLIAGEISEAHEEIRSGHPLTETYYPGKVTGKEYSTQSPIAVEKPEGFPSELADVFIRLMDLAEEAEVDLAKVVKEKLAYNTTRPFKHNRAF